MEQGPVSVYVAANSSEAHLIRGLLLAEGIDAQITGENQASAGLSTAMPIEVLVSAEFVERALALLAVYQETRSVAEDVSAVPIESATTESEALERETAEVETAEVETHPGLPSVGAIWLEVGVVLSFVAMFYCNAIAGWIWPDTEAQDFWGVRWNYYSFSMDFPVIFVVLYLMWRSEKSWAEFGIVRPSLILDLPLGGCYWMMDMGLWIVFASMLSPVAWGKGAPTPEAGGWFVHSFAVVTIFVGAFMEELVLRCYLITRFQQLLRSSALSVLLAALLFTGYHMYQGLPGLLGAGLMGVLYGTMFCLVRRIWPLTIAHMLMNLLSYWMYQQSSSM